MRFFIAIIFLLFLFSGHSKTFGKGIEYVYTSKNISFYIAPDGPVSDTQIPQLPFRKCTEKDQLHRRVDQDIYLKIQPTDRLNPADQWYLEAIDPHISDIQLFLQYPDTIICSTSSGFDQIFDVREVDHKNFVYPIKNFEGQLPDAIYIRLNFDHPIGLFFKIRSSAFLIHYITAEYLFLGIFYGIIFFLIFYNLFVFITLKDPIHLYFVLYVSSLCLMTLHDDGLGFQMLWNKFPLLNDLFAKSRRILFLVVFAFYSVNFLKPFIYKKGWLSPLKILCLLAVIGNIFGEQGLLSPTLQATLYLLPFCWIYLMGIYTVRKNYLPGKFFVFGYTFMLIGLLINSSRMGIATTDTIWYAYALNIGMLIEITALSWGLSLKFSILKQQKEKAQRRIIRQMKENERVINEKVIQRTEKVREQQQIIALRNNELELAHQQLKTYALEIEEKNQLLYSANLELEADVEDLTDAHVLDIDLSYEDFSRKFPDEEASLLFIEKLKWSSGYKCQKCGNKKFAVGKGRLSRRCTKCGFNESVTKDTLFFRAHFSCQQGLYMLYLSYHHKFQMPSAKMSELVTLNANTCWKFQKKVKERDALFSKHQLQEPALGWAMYILDPPKSYLLES